MSTSTTSTVPTGPTYKASTAYLDPDFHWSLDGRSNKLHSYRESVKEGLDRSFDRYKLGAMATEDSQWLAYSQGQYKAFFSMTSRQVQQYRLAKEKALNLPSGTLEGDAVKYHFLQETKRMVNVGESPRFCNNRTSLKGQTWTDYEETLSKLWDFLAMIADYDSMIIMLCYPPQHCPSMSAESLRSFMFHRAGQYKNVVLDSKNNEVKDTQGRTVLAEGTIRNTARLNSLIAAVRHVHLVNNKACDYTEQCSHCLQAFHEDSYSCPFHIQGMYRCNTGLPSSWNGVVQMKKSLDVEMAESKYEIKKMHPLFPSDLIDIQNYVSGNNYKLQDLMYYTMILASLDCGLRYDGMASITSSV